MKSKTYPSLKKNANSVTFEEALKEFNLFSDQSKLMLKQKLFTDNYSRSLAEIQKSIHQKKPEEQKEIIEELSIKAFAQSPIIRAKTQNLPIIIHQFLEDFSLISSRGHKELSGKKSPDSAKITDIQQSLLKSIQALSEISKNIEKELIKFLGDPSIGNDILLPVNVAIIQGSRIDPTTLEKFMDVVLVKFYELTVSLKQYDLAKLSIENSGEYFLLLNLGSASSYYLTNLCDHVEHDDCASSAAVSSNPNTVFCDTQHEDYSSYSQLDLQFIPT